MSEEVAVGLEAQNVAVWSRTASSYAVAAEVMTAPAAEPLLDAAGVGRGTALLDVGTGPGTVIGAAVRRAARVVGIDLSEAMVAAAQSRFPGVDVRVGNASALPFDSLPFDSMSFDSVSFAFCLLVLPEPDRALAEALRVLRPGGRVGLTSWASSGLEAMEVGGGAVAELGVSGRLIGRRRPCSGWSRRCSSKRSPALASSSRSPICSTSRSG